MVRHYSEDLRWRMVFLSWDGYNSREISALLHVGKSTVNRVVHLYEATGLVSSFPKARRATLMQPDDYVHLAQCVAADPSLYLDEFRDLVNRYRLEHGREEISLATLFRSLKIIGMTRKKLSIIALEAQLSQHADYVALLSVRGYGSQHLVFVDETSSDNRTQNRRYGWSLLGQRCRKTGHFVRGIRYSTVAAMHETGVQAFATIEGSYTAELFETFIMTLVVPCMAPFPAAKSVLVLDGAMIHRCESMLAAMKARGLHVLFLPPYSPDFDPVENLFSKLKHFLRRHSSRLTRDGMSSVDVIRCGLYEVRAEDCLHWVRRSGYFPTA